MSAPEKTTEPAAIRAGDTINWLIDAPDFSAASGWQLQYTLINATGKITFASAAEGSQHRVSVAASTTATYAPGAYGWLCRAVHASAGSYTLREGSIEVLPNIAAATTLDTRTHAQKTLAALEAWIEGRNLAVAEYEIAGRRMKYIPMGELLKLRSQYRAEVFRESRRSGRVLLRF